MKKQRGVEKILRYQEIKNEIKVMIDGMNSGDKFPSRTKLAKRLDSSRATVDKAIKELEAEGFVKSQYGSGTFVIHEMDGVVRNLSNWCLILPNISEIIYGKLATSIERIARTCNANVILCNSENNIEVQSEYIKRLSMSGVDGFIIVPVITHSLIEGVSLFQRLVESKIPFVFCNREIEGVSAPVIKSNDFLGGYLATSHLLEHGYRNIVYFSAIKYKTSIDRCQGYISAIQQHGESIVRKRILLLDNESISDACIKLSELIKSDSSIDSIFCFNDNLALSTMETVEKLNLRVSRDIGIIGYDDNVDSRFRLKVPLTSVSYEIEEVGALAAHALQKRIDSGHNESFEYYLVKPRVIERESCLGKGEKDYEHYCYEEIQASGQNEA